MSLTLPNGTACYLPMYVGSEFSTRSQNCHEHILNAVYTLS